MIVSSICVPSDLGSKATLTPVPKTPQDGTHPDNITLMKNINKILDFIF
jgi:hypothetical protein